METIHHPALDSTSAEAARLIAAGRRPPFAVTAARQSGGRGRRGHAWVSPPGNLYLTLALPAAGPVTAAWGLLPLKAGWHVARVIERHLGIRVTLKWPNDLLFGGAKLGGLLLESSVNDGQAGAVLIGIGLNLNAAPELPGPYPATSLRAVTGHEHGVAAWTRWLVEEFGADWASAPGPASSHVLAAWNRYALPAGDLWFDPTSGRYAESVGVREDGCLGLAVAGHGEAAGETVWLTSADHRWQWIHLGAEGKAPLLVADVGNTAVKLARFATAAAAEPESVQSVRHETGGEVLAAALRAIGAGMPAPGWPLRAVSVNPAGLSALRAAAVGCGLRVLECPRRGVRRHGDRYAESDLGMDRLAAIEGWLSPADGRPRAADTAGVIVSAGTAVTVDLVLGQGFHLGGCIAPGQRLGLEALTAGAALLPALAPQSAPPAAAVVDGMGSDAGGPGHDTESAIRQGVRLEAAGLVLRLRDWLRRTRPDLARIDTVVTGGDASWLVPAIPDARTEPGLVLHGVRVLALGGLSAPASAPAPAPAEPGLGD